MSSANAYRTDRAGFPISLYRLFAVVAGLLSLLTTVWAVEWIWPGGNPLHRWLVALVAEGLLIAMKASLLNGSADDDSLGWSGVLIDALINAGGIVPRGAAIVSFPPIAILLQIATVYDELSGLAAVVNAQPITWGGLIAAAVGGILLSVLPHKLWKRG